MSRYQPALFGGLFIGILSALPVVNWANVCCCAWVVAGGVLTTYLLQHSRTTPVESGEAALHGLGAGFVGGLIYVLLTAIVLSGVMGGQVAEQLRAALDQNPQVPAEVRDRFISLAESGGLMIVAGLVTVPVMAIFSLLGALLGVAIFKKQTPPAAAEPPVQRF